MPVQIGTKGHDFSEPIGLLSDCRRRIGRFLGSLQRVAEVIDPPLTNEARAALETACVTLRRQLPSTLQTKKNLCSLASDRFTNGTSKVHLRL